MELALDKLTKMYGKKLALDSFSYSFHEGIYGLLGPNGAGKSTLMGIVTTGLKATSGTVSFNGTEIAAMGKDYRALIGFMPQQQRIYEDFSLMRFLYYIAALKGCKKSDVEEQIDDIVKSVNLWEVRNDRIGTYSGGMKQRTLLAQALVGNPAILIIRDLPFAAQRLVRSNRNLIAQIVIDGKNMYYFYDTENDTLLKSVEMKGGSQMYLLGAVGDSYYGSRNNQFYYISTEDFWNGAFELATQLTENE